MQSCPEEGVHEKHKHRWAETEDSRAQPLTRPQKKLTFMLHTTESPSHPTVSLWWHQPSSPLKHLSLQTEALSSGI